VPLLLCPQSLFKIHPDNDALFARVLAAAPAARLVVFEGRHPTSTTKYRARLGAAFAREGVRIDERLIVLPQCGHDDYLRINAACDAMLDTHAGREQPTSMRWPRAPIVTLPGAVRGWQAPECSLAGLDDLVARRGRRAHRRAARRRWREIAARIRDDGAGFSAMRRRYAIRRGAGNVVRSR
jgi:CRISPR-associated protein Csy1